MQDPAGINVIAPFDFSKHSSFSLHPPSYAQLYGDVHSLLYCLTFNLFFLSYFLFHFGSLYLLRVAILAHTSTISHACISVLSPKGQICLRLSNTTRNGDHTSEYMLQIAHSECKSECDYYYI